MDGDLLAALEGEFRTVDRDAFDDTLDEPALPLRHARVLRLALPDGRAA